MEDRIFMTPTLVKLAPGPVARIVGTLSQTDLVLQVLGLEDLAA
jgi:circadian clock protein KaiB